MSEYQSIYKCECVENGKQCADELYVQPDEIKGRRLVMIGCESDEEAYILLTPDTAKMLAFSILNLATYLESKETKNE